jgi:hypothetical protein
MIPHFLDKQLRDGSEVVSLACLLYFTPTEIFWYSSLLKDEETQGPWCDWKD